MYAQRAQTSADPEDPDFGLPDPKRDLDRRQNCTTWSLSHALPLEKISSKSVHKFASNPMDRQTDRTKNITSFFGGGNNGMRPNVRSPILGATWRINT